MARTLENRIARAIDKAAVAFLCKMTVFGRRRLSGVDVAAVIIKRLIDVAVLQDDAGARPRIGAREATNIQGYNHIVE